MMKRKIKKILNVLFIDKRFCGFTYHILGMLMLLLFALIGSYISIPYRWLFQGIARGLLGVGYIFLASKIYKIKIKDILSFKNWKFALVLSIGIIIELIMLIIQNSLYITKFCDTLYNPQYFIYGLVIFQFGVGLLEEMLCRFIMLQGFFYLKKPTEFKKLIYLLINVFSFSLGHMLNGWNWYSFIFTSIFALSIGVIFLLSQNIIIPMIIHFVWDFFAWHFNNYFVCGRLSTPNQHILNILFQVFALLSALYSSVWLFVDYKKTKNLSL